MVIAGPRDADNGAGCQLWISTCQPWVVGDRASLLRPEHVQPLHVADRAVIVGIHAPFIKLRVAIAHAL
eukprot:11759037-Alexandrium_andersonii.AAC.1